MQITSLGLIRNFQIDWLKVTFLGEAGSLALLSGGSDSIRGRSVVAFLLAFLFFEEQLRSHLLEPLLGASLLSLERLIHLPVGCVYRDTYPLTPPVRLMTHSWPQSSASTP